MRVRILTFRLTAPEGVEHVRRVWPSLRGCEGDLNGQVEGGCDSALPVVVWSWLREGRLEQQASSVGRVVSELVVIGDVVISESSRGGCGAGFVDKFWWS